MDEQLQKLVIPAAVGVVAFCGGLGLGYILGSQRKVTVYRDAPDTQPRTEERPPKVVIEESTEIETDSSFEMKHEPIVLTPNPDPADITVDEEAVARIADLTHTWGYPKALELFRAERDGSGEDDYDPVDEEVVNVFAGTSGKWDYDEELKHRTKDAPYVVHKDEFWAEESGYDQTTLTYFKGDNILVDDKDVPIYNFEQVIGPLKFGHGSGDPNVFHIRNDKHEAEYEILLDRGSYAVEILGLDATQETEKEEALRHSSKKFRPDD